MIPPAGFAAAAEFPGFQSPEAEASIMVTELPVPASQMKRGMTKTTLASRGMTLLHSSTQTTSSGSALLLNVAQSAAGREFLKWMLVGGDSNVTIMIVATYPKGADAQLGPAMRASVLSASWTGNARPDPFDGLLFRVEPSATLKLGGRVSNMLMLTESGGTTAKSPDEAVYIVGNSIGQGQIGDLPAFSERRLKQTKRMSGFRNLAGTPVTVDGLPGYELLADATDATTGQTMKLYLAIVPDGGGYYIMQGYVPLGRAQEMVPEFRRITATFRRAGM